MVSCREKEQYHLLTIELDKQRQYFMLCQYTLVDTGFVRRVIYEERNISIQLLIRQILRLLIIGTLWIIVQIIFMI